MLDSEEEGTVWENLPVFFINVVLVFGVLIAFGSRKEGFKCPQSPVVFVIVASNYSSFQILFN